jgi:hypothetical protein
MATITELLTNNQSITASGLASLANGSAFGLAAVDNTTNQDLDAGALTLTIKTNAAGTSATGYVSVFLAGSPDGGTTWPDTYTGAAAVLTLTSPTNLLPLGNMNAVANATSYKKTFASVATIFGYLPGKWGVIVQNNTGAALDSTAGSFACVYERVRGTSA